MEAYGCSANMADAEIAMGILRSGGYEYTENPSEADINIIVTCAVKRPTADRMLHRVRRLRALGRPLIVAGCMASGETDAVRRSAPEALLIHPRQITRISEAAGELLRGRRVDLLSGQNGPKLGLPRVRRNRAVSIIPVSEGCRWSRCSFCIVPAARGSFGSYPIQLILEEARRSIAEGAREIWLTSQDMGSYGLESGRNMLPDLISLVSSLDGRFMTRVGMMNPIYLRPILERLTSSFGSPRVFKFLHLPVQSGSDHILREMNRGHGVDLFLEIVRAFREAYPQLTLSTDVIVGYPAEDEGDFEETMRLIERVEPDTVNVSRYYPRPGTPAERMGELPPGVMNRRSRLLSDLCREVALRRNEAWIGWSGEAIVDEVGERGEAIARNQSYKPIVLRGARGGELLGRFVEVEVEEARPYCLMGRLKSAS